MPPFPLSRWPSSSQGTPPFTVGNPVGIARHARPERRLRRGVEQREGLRRHLLGRELLVRRAARRDRRAATACVPQNVQANDAFVSFINHDGSVNTARWIGVQSPADRAKLTPALVLNEPYGSDIINGRLYVADRDGGTSPSDPSVAVIRAFDLKTGAPAWQARVPGVDWINDIEVTDDGTVYATRTGNQDATDVAGVAHRAGRDAVAVRAGRAAQPAQRHRLRHAGEHRRREHRRRRVLTFSPAGKLLKTEHAAQAGNDGLVIMRDGTKYVSSVRFGGVSRIRPASRPS